ncbi:hypothetical protein FRC07_001622, partial [Ceratobasidium sp. 392]
APPSSRTPVDRTVFIASQSQSATPRPPKSRSPKSITPPDRGRSSPQPQPSIAVFRDCFGVLTSAENVFPAHPRSHSRSGSDAGSGSIGGRGRSEFQRRWTKRWLRRTVRGVGSMGSGSGSGSSIDAPTPQRARSSGGNSGGLFLSSTGRQSASGSQDSLDRVRVSRSNAGSPSEGITRATRGAELSDVDEGETDAEGGDSPDQKPEVKGTDAVAESGAHKLAAALEPIVNELVATRPNTTEPIGEVEAEMPTVSVPAAA